MSLITYTIISLQKQLEKPLQLIEGSKNIFFENQTIDNCRRTAHQNWLKTIYSLTYNTSQVHILKLQLKMNYLIGLAVMVLFAYTNTANCKLQKIQFEPCTYLCHSFSITHIKMMCLKEMCALCQFVRRASCTS